MTSQSKLDGSNYWLIFIILSLLFREFYFQLIFRIMFWISWSFVSWCEKNNARFFISNTFTSIARLKLVKKIKQKLSNTPEAKLLLFENYSHSSPKLSSKNNGATVGLILKNKKKNKCVYIHEIIRLTIMKMKMKNRSHRYHINRPRHGHKYRKYRKCLSIMTLITY